MVNIALLALRGDRVEHHRFGTPTAQPVLGAITSAILASPLADRGAGVHVRAGTLLPIGVGLRAVKEAVITAAGKSGALRLTGRHLASRPTHSSRSFTPWGACTKGKCQNPHLP
ncbi:hypothetical protein HFP43_22050 [Streptomyces sp. SJ1-7]|nr:hypothetical protein [Streptomyces sp. SJ1-7]